MLEIIGLRILRRQNLKQHTTGSRLTIHFTGADEQAGWQLFGTHEVIFQAGGKRVAFQTDNALIALTLFRRDRDNQVAISDQRFQIRIFRDIALNARHAAHLLLVIAVDHRQRHRAITLQLNGNIASELQRGGQQAGGNQQFAQQGFHRQRVVVVFQNLFPGFGYGDQLAAHGELFKQIAV
ncbi:Uncharacterised protein [Enterobacter hormaechei]|nr:Uncharacterised protein [Enterobacter hormaechei]SAH25639.1 Uncharacterised protein [Enterobacter hormaechei]